MLFYTLESIAFMIGIVFCFFIINSKKIRFVLMLFASFAFYYWWEITNGIGKISHGIIYLFPLYLTIFLVVVSVLPLFFYKYSYFIANNLIHLSSAILRRKVTAEPAVNYLKSFVLPLGISFFTFQILSYSFDVYRRKFKSTRNYLHLALYALYFPQLIAGPIMRFNELSPQLKMDRAFHRMIMMSENFIFFSWYVQKSIYC